MILFFVLCQTLYQIQEVIVAILHPTRQDFSGLIHLPNIAAEVRGAVTYTQSNGFGPTTWDKAFNACKQAAIIRGRHRPDVIWAQVPEKFSSISQRSQWDVMLQTAYDRALHRFGRVDHIKRCRNESGYGLYYYFGNEFVVVEHTSDTNSVVIVNNVPKVYGHFHIEKGINITSGAGDCFAVERAVRLSVWSPLIAHDARPNFGHHIYYL
ncbi:hypothetical protein [Pseudomonas sp. HLS-6]|uniref:hypothetical protein n=1 Tax=Pseudomonas sp. HLS-6 TaxID=2049589 RepID=UPI0012FDA29B|nr:hypothetical protein [Pseudomonas sp. HLS-6]